MSEKELTAVEWFYNQMPKKIQPHYKKQLEQAKEMEEEQKCRFANEYADNVMSGMMKTAEDFLTEYETFKQQ